MTTASSVTRPGSEPPRVPFLDVGASYRELKAEIDEAYHRVMGGGRYVLGDELEAFEADFAASCASRECVGVASGLDALFLILAGYGIGPGDEVIVPSHTFIATWLAVSRTGASPVPVEPDQRTCNLDPGRIAASITERTRAVVAVHLYGQPAAMEQIAEIASRHGLRLIEDAAQAHGARWNNKPAGSLADAAAFSFYPSKNLGAYGDGGAVVTDNPELAARVRALRNYGGERKYQHDVQGINSRLDALQAAFLRVRLAHLEEWNERRRAVARAYLEGLAGSSNVILPQTRPEASHAWHLFVIRHPQRARLRLALDRRGIEAAIHYPVPPHLSGAYAAAGWQRGDFPLAEELSDSVLSLPIGPHVPRVDVQRVIDAVRSAESEIADS